MSNKGQGTIMYPSSDDDEDALKEMDEDVYIVEAIVFSFKGKYLVKWKGYSFEHCTWEPKSTLAGCDDLMDQYQNCKDEDKFKMSSEDRNRYPEEAPKVRLESILNERKGGEILLVKWKGLTVTTCEPREYIEKNYKKDYKYYLLNKQRKRKRDDDSMVESSSSESEEEEEEEEEPPKKKRRKKAPPKKKAPKGKKKKKKKKEKKKKKKKKKDEDEYVISDSEESSDEEEEKDDGPFFETDSVAVVRAIPKKRRKGGEYVVDKFLCVDGSRFMYVESSDIDERFEKGDNQKWKGALNLYVDQCKQKTEGERL